MAARWFRRALRSFGVELPFTQVVCPEEVKTVSIDARWRGTVTVQRILVFLQTPERGDLRDVYPVDPSVDRSCTIHGSTDAREIMRRKVAEGTVVYWQPVAPIVRHALYAHEQSWSAQVSDTDTTVFAAVHCEIPTGIVAVHMVAPMIFEAGVAFRLPMFRRLNTERRLMEYAIARLDESRLRPSILDGGQRAEWKIVGPKTGDRYVCIAFTAEGLEEWRQHLRDTSLAGRLRRLFRVRSDGRRTSATRMT